MISTRFPGPEGIYEFLRAYVATPGRPTRPGLGWPANTGAPAPGDGLAKEFAAPGRAGLPAWISALRSALGRPAFLFLALNWR